MSRLQSEPPIRRRKTCGFCADKIDFVDYKDPTKLKKFVTERGKILPRRMTGVCARHQRWLGVAIKRARNIALLPFAGSAAGTQAPRVVVPGAAAGHAAPATPVAAAPAAVVTPAAGAEAPKA